MKQIIIAITAILLASSCTTYRKYTRPEELTTNNLFGADITPHDTTTIASIPWSDFFRDTLLQALIDTGLTNNADLQIASLRVAQAEATLSAAQLAYLPGVSLTPQGNISRYAGEKTTKTYSLGLSADWEIDIAGKLTNEKRGALASLQQQRDYRQAVATQLVATIANSYFHLLTLDEQLRISIQTLDAWNEIIRTLEACKKVGEANEAAVAQASANKLDVENSILTLSCQLKTMEHSLCSLLGWTPQTINRSTLKSQVFPDSLTIGIPLQMLDHRPDIREAEHALQAAFYAVNTARAAFYPSLTLSGTIGWTNNSGAAIVNPGNWLLNAIGSLTLPLFNRGRNIANLKIAKAQQQEALIAFRQKLLEAGAEVNDALAQWQYAQQQLDISHRQIESLEKAAQSTRLLMTHSDTATYLEVLTAQQALLAARLNETQETFHKIQGLIKLYHSLGGGGADCQPAPPRIRNAAES